jgi:membrane associated rhomboid family serine protease
VNRFPSKKSFTEPVIWLKSLILTNILVCIASILSAPILLQLKLPPLSALLSLSSWGLSKGYYWQLVSYIFAIPLQQSDLSLILNLVFSSFFLWNVGSAVIQAKGLKDFLAIYIGGAFLGACVVAGFMHFSATAGMIAGPSAAFYGLLAAWMILVPEMQILLFMTIPIRIKWLVTGVLASTLLIDFSNGNFINFISPYRKNCYFFWIVARQTSQQKTLLQSFFL